MQKLVVLAIACIIGQICFMVKADITTWLDSHRDYTEGAALYAKYGKSEVLKGLFKAGNNSFNRKKLLEEITKLANKQGKPKPGPKPQSTPKTHSKPQSPIDASKLPDALKDKWYNQYIPALKQQSTCHSQLMLVDEERREQLAGQIDELEMEIRQLHAQFVYYNEHGTIQPTATDASPEWATLRVSELIKERNNARSRKSRYKSKKQFDKIPAVQQLLDQLDALIEEKENG